MKFSLKFHKRSSIHFFLIGNNINVYGGRATLVYSLHKTHYMGITIKSGYKTGDQWHKFSFPHHI